MIRNIILLAIVGIATYHGSVWLAAYHQAITTPCPTEDSEYCFWDAHARGDGNGRSFVNMGD